MCSLVCPTEQMPTQPCCHTAGECNPGKACARVSGHQAETANASSTAARVSSRSAVECTVDRKSASNCDGAK